MLEMIIKRKWYLQKHLDAPLLKEREDYLEIMAQKGMRIPAIAVHQFR